DRVRPSDEHLPEAGLEGADALAGRRGSDAEDEGRTFDGAFVHGGGEGLDVLDVHEAIVHQLHILLFSFSAFGPYCWVRAHSSRRRPAHRVVAYHRCRTAERTHPP